MRVSSVDVVSESGSSSVGMTGNATVSAVRFPVATPAPDRRITWGTMTGPSGPEAAADFESVRSRLFGIAYQLLGRAVDAEDVVQDVWVRWQGADRARVRDRVAFLVTIRRGLRSTRQPRPALVARSVSTDGYRSAISHPSIQRWRQNAARHSSSQ